LQTCCRFIDQTLQLSNLPALSGYLFGGKNVSNILGRWDGDVVAGTLDELSKQVRDSGLGWVQAWLVWFGRVLMCFTFWATSIRNFEGQHSGRAVYAGEVG
jgi:hypothetical protein